MQYSGEVARSGRNRRNHLRPDPTWTSDRLLGHCALGGPGLGFPALLVGLTWFVVASACALALVRGRPRAEGVIVANADFIGVTAGSYHSLGLKSDGSIVAWGDLSGADTSLSQVRRQLAEVRQLLNANQPQPDPQPAGGCP